jgi:nucleoside-diphosphate-sugar epimerase
LLLLSELGATAPLPQLEGRRILLTGGTGFVGRALLDRLIALQDTGARSFEVAVLSRDPQRFLQMYPEYDGRQWLRYCTGSLDNLAQLDGTYTDVIHAAADTHVSSNRADWADQIVLGTRRMLDMAVKCGAKRFLFTSSGAVYGPQPDSLAKMDEAYLGAPLPTALSSVYGQAKRQAEQLCTIYKAEYGLETVITRLFAVSGKHLPADGPYAIGNFIRDALFADEIHVQGSGEAIRTYLDGEDVSDWLLCLLERGIPGEAYNVGSDRPVSIRDLAFIVQALLSPDKPVRIGRCERDNGARSRYVPSVEKVGNMGLSQTVDLEQSILNAAESFKKRKRKNHSAILSARV